MIILYLTFQKTARFFQSGLTFTFSPTVYEASNISTSSPTVIIGLFDNSYLEGCEMASCCGFDLHFPDG